MSFKCVFRSLVFRRLKLTNLLLTEYSRSPLILCTHTIGVRHAGHSHWQNIKKTKESKDLAKCRSYNLYINLMKKEILNGGSSDPKLNSKLASIIKQAQAIHMPINTINNAIKRFEYCKNNPRKMTCIYKGSNGVIYLIDILSENLLRSRTELNSVFKKAGISRADDNVRTAFIIKGNVIAKPPENTSNLLEKSIEDAIEVGAEEVEPVEEEPDCVKFICEDSDLNSVRSKLEKKNYTIENYETILIPRSPVELEEKELEKIYEFLNKVEELPFVDNIAINIV